MQGFEQVRLAGPVLADDEHDAGQEVELEGGIGAVVPERDALDDQRRFRPCYPARRIGMIRYV
jgi:hypothetical protein